MATPTTSAEQQQAAIPTQGGGEHEDDVRAGRLFGLPVELTGRPDGQPFAPATRLTELAAEGPVHRVTTSTGQHSWLVTGHEQARAVLADPRFSVDVTRSEQAMARLPEEVRERFTDQSQRAGNLIAMDVPEHTRVRKLLTGQFTVRRMRQLEPRIHQIVTDHLDALVAAGPTADLVPSFALPVPSLVISELLGVDYADRGEFQTMTAKLLRLDTPLEEVLAASDKLRAFMRGLVLAKRANPTDDLLSGLAHSTADPALTDDELINIANLLLIAGHETTANMLALGAFALLEHPDQLAALRDDPERMPAAVEELLRYLTIVHLGMRRFPLEDVVVAGVAIPAGETVIISAQLANLDPSHYPSPTALDVTRPRGPHLSFGHGIHQCLGQQLARVEMATGFTELLRRLPGLRLAVPATEVPLRDDMAIYGVHELLIDWDATAARAI
ncbi:cytochrome P450 [Actinokineospora inagensis]|uniref:cytochrome P450 n=1 Tax=Actinokineospora inagensis TaxID=103730 RepID=UPI00042321D7|nr:cytochrome P450 [Actinokineospora inagensis]